MMNLLKCFPKIDIYTKTLLKPSVFTQEHIIPKRFFDNPKHANDLFNLAPTHLKINYMRSDLKFGNIDMIQPHNLTQILIPNPVAYIDRKKRIFYPTIIADKGLIARSIIEMLYKYPYLYTYIYDIIDHPETLWKWTHDHPNPSIFEKSRNEYLKRYS
jgi:endonuclease I